jgi:palmitoyltransferase ZDHHC3/7/25
MVFLFWVFVVSAYALILIIAKYSTCSMSRRSDLHHFASHLVTRTMTIRSKYYCGGPADSLFVLMLLVEAILFGLFTLCMLADQTDSITSNQSQIDRLKNQNHMAQVEVNEVFGTPRQVK